ncbi:MAG: hypothetical protein LBK58_02520 [Prevotellaceae bacterium]|jgi:hypothetical protein|nr:hypothetical protein [Prevotellaceae bacterium]
MGCIKTYRLWAALVLLSSCGERVTVSDLDSLGLRYRVKSMDESFYIADSRFDTIVLQTKLYQYKYRFHHDSRYMSVEKKLFPGSPASSDSILSVPETDSVKQPFPHAFKEPGYCFINYRYVSDSLTVLEITDAHGSLISRIDRKYAGRRLLSEERYSGSGSLLSKSGFRYDSRHRLLNSAVFYENGYRETDYAYSPGEKIESGSEFNCRYRFDINGRVSDRRTYRGVAPVAETHFEYNGCGDLIAMQEIDREGTVNRTVYEYSYDSGNNWTLCVEYSCTGNIFVRKREITYYN